MAFFNHAPEIGNRVSQSLFQRHRRLEIVLPYSRRHLRGEGRRTLGLGGEFCEIPCKWLLTFLPTASRSNGFSAFRSADCPCIFACSVYT
jgi:hypothetical protein